jgi:O-antigen ligase
VRGGIYAVCADTHVNFTVDHHPTISKLVLCVWAVVLLGVVLTTNWWFVFAPAWSLVVLVVGLTAVAWHLDSRARRRARLGFCPNCNYDRTGILADSPCPECGAALLTKPRKMTP